MMLKTNAGEIFPVALRGFLWLAHAGQNILLYHAPAFVTDLIQFRQQRGEVNIAFTQFAEHTGTYRLEVVPAFLDALLSESGVIILEMEVPDALSIFLQALHGIASAETIVTAIEDETQQVGIGKRHELFDLGGCFHISGAVMMESRAQAGFFLDCGSDLLGTFGKDLPLGIAQAHFRSDAPGILGAFGDGAVFVSEDNERQIAFDSRAVRTATSMPAR